MHEVVHATPSSPILGRYEMLMPIGKGGMATVWAARVRGSRGFQRIVAVKSILPEYVRDPSFERMLFEEASLAARIHHPHVAEILDLAEHEGSLFIVMEWVDGEPLGAIVRAAGEGGVPLPVALRIIGQACAGLHAAHELRDESGASLGLVHRDVSPQNVLVTFDGVVKVVDFGIAKAAGRIDDLGPSQIRGKAAYMSPEQANGDDVDRRSDLFALGVLLYWMTTGRHPFRAKTQDETLANIRRFARVRPPSQLVPGYPRALEEVVVTALARDRSARFATADEMLCALDRALPESERASTDEVVAAFMRKVLSSKHDERWTALRDALRAGDERRVRFDAEDAISGTRFKSGFQRIGAVEVSALAQELLTPSPVSGPVAPKPSDLSDIGPNAEPRGPEVERSPKISRGRALRLALAVVLLGLIGATWFGLGPHAGRGAPQARADGREPPTTRDELQPKRGIEPSGPKRGIEPSGGATSEAAAVHPAEAAEAASVPPVGGGEAVRTSAPSNGSARGGAGAGTGRSPWEGAPRRRAIEPAGAAVPRGTSGDSFIPPVREPGF